MVIINQIGKLLVEAPTGVWEKIIMAFNSNIANYALAIICLTLVIKLVLFPFDFLNRKFTRKSTKMQAEIQPEIDVLKKKYGNNQKELNAKTMEVYKKHNYNVGGTCLVTLITMVLTMVVFFTLFAGLNKMSSYKVAQQYEDLRLAYYGVEKVEDIASVDLSTLNEEEARARVLEEYKAKKESFLWIENVWMADSPFKNPVPTFSEYAKLAGLSDEQQTEEAKQEYEKVWAVVNENTRDQNGYFGIAILIIGVAFLQQFVTNKKYRFKKKKLTDNEFEEKKMPTNKVMMIVLPLILGVFGILYNSVFGLYMLASSVFAVITTPLCNNILEVVEKKEEEKRKRKEKLTYSRK